MNQKLQYGLLLLVALGLGGGIYYYFDLQDKSGASFASKSEFAHEVFREKNKEIFEKLGVEYLRNTVVINPVINEVDVKHSEQYLKAPNHYDGLEKKYGALIPKGYVAPSTVRFIDDVVGCGLFAEADIEKDQFVGEYTGRIIDTDKDLKDSKYSWDYPIRHDKRGNPIKNSLDAWDAGNELRFVNHDDKPNAEVRMMPQGGLWHVTYIATRPIKKGDQILTSYGQKYWGGKRKGKKRIFVKDDGTQ